MFASPHPAQSRLTGKLKLDSQLAINEKIRGQLFRAISDNFQPISDPGYFALNFQVGGSVDRPRTNLMDKLVGRDLKDLVMRSTACSVAKSERGQKEKTDRRGSSSGACRRLLLQK